MATVAREVERKYEGTPVQPGQPGLPEDLARRLPGVASVEEEPTRSLDATYYDTPDLRLAAAGITLRRRTGEGPKEDGWHLKLPVGEDARDEIRAAPSKDTPRALTRLVRAHTRDRALVPAVRIRTTRTPRTLRDADGRVLAEIAVDQVSARVIDPVAPGVPALPQEWSEVEVELAEGVDPALLDAVEQSLTSATDLHRSSSPSKLARALEGRLATTRVRPRTTPRKRTAEPTAADTVLAYVATQAHALIDLDPAVRRELPDSVHQMRVAARRLRSTLRAFRSILDQGSTNPLVDELRWLGGELGVDRDREVLTERIRQAVADTPRPLVIGPVRGRLRTWSTAQRSGSRRRTLAALDGPRYLALLDRLDALLAEPPLLDPAAHRPAPQQLHKVLRREYRRVESRIKAAEALPPNSAERAAALHDARKAAKRARYAAETARPAVGKPAKRYRKAMRDLQELLGEHHDSITAREALREIAVQAHQSGENAFTYGLLHQREAERSAEAEEALPALWDRVRDDVADAVS